MAPTMLPLIVDLGSYKSSVSFDFSPFKRERSRRSIPQLLTLEEISLSHKHMEDHVFCCLIVDKKE